MFGTAGKMPLGTPESYVGARVQVLAPSQVQLPATVLPRRQQVMVQVLGLCGRPRLNARFLALAAPATAIPSVQGMNKISISVSLTVFPSFQIK